MDFEIKQNYIKENDKTNVKIHINAPEYKGEFFEFSIVLAFSDVPSLYLAVFRDEIKDENVLNYFCEPLVNYLCNSKNILGYDFILKIKDEEIVKRVTS